MYRRVDPLISASRGTLAGDLLWLGTIGFILAIITGMIGLSGPAHCSRRKPVPWPDKANPQPCNRGSEAIPLGRPGAPV